MWYILVSYLDLFYFTPHHHESIIMISTLKYFCFKYNFRNISTSRSSSSKCILKLFYCLLIFDRWYLVRRGNDQPVALLAPLLPVHSSEMRGLRSTKCSSETLQNLLYFMYKKTHVVFFRFSFRATLYFYLMNALVYVDIDQHEMKNEKNYMGFLIHKI